jgi:hypothetical protein
VVQLRDRKLHASPRLSAINRDAEPAIVGHGHAVPIGRIDPHVVVMPPGAAIGVSVRPPSSDRENDDERKKISFSLSGETAHRV